MDTMEYYMGGCVFNMMIRYKRNINKQRILLSGCMMYASLFIVAMVQGVSAEEEQNQASSTTKETANPIQQYCPVMKKNKIDPAIFLEYQGKKVYFCCDVCKAAFQKNPEKYLGNLPQFHQGVPEPSIKNDRLAQVVSDVAGHDHGSDHTGEVHGVNRLVRFLGKFHPLVVHFPIALILVTALAEVLVLIQGGTFYTAARFCLILAALGAIVAMLLGLAAEDFAHFSGKFNEVLETHELFGVITTINIVVAAIVSEIARRTKRQNIYHLYRVLLLSAVILVSITGYYGGTLVYGPHHFTW